MDAMLQKDSERFVLSKANSGEELKVSEEIEERVRVSEEEERVKNAPLTDAAETVESDVNEHDVNETVVLLMLNTVSLLESVTTTYFFCLLKHIVSIVELKCRKKNWNPSLLVSPSCSVSLTVSVTVCAFVFAEYIRVGYLNARGWASVEEEERTMGMSE